MTRFYIDTEFDEDGRTIELISIGIVCENGAEYYAVSRDFDPAHCNDWVREHVLSHLPPAGATEWRTKREIAQEVRGFIESLTTSLKPEIWAYYADYDWVVLCQLFGRMVDLPPGFPMFCLDVKQEMERYGVLSRDLPPQPDKEQHHALADARWTKLAHEWLEQTYGNRSFGVGSR